MLYNEIVQKFLINGCTLLTTEEEFEKLNEITYQSHIKLDFIAKCGHQNQVVLKNFILRGKGINCKNCIIKNNKEKKALLINTQAASITHCIESTGYNEIIKLIDSNFIIKKTNEGCLADFIIQPRDTNENIWLPIQLKTTQKEICNMYSFNLRNKYNDMIIICYCIDEKEWAIAQKILQEFFAKYVATPMKCC